MQSYPLADQFVQSFPPDGPLPGCLVTAFFAQVEALAIGFTDFLTKCGGGSFRQGLYRLHTPDGIQKWTAIIQDSFPECRNRVMCFGYDWLGRHFALDSERVVDGQAQVLLFDPGFHEVLHIPCSFDVFHRTELPQFANDALFTQNGLQLAVACRPSRNVWAIAFHRLSVVRMRYRISR